MSGNVGSYPSAEPALNVHSREELVYLLGQACEIEHGVMCEYLYAQFNPDPRPLNRLFGRPRTMNEPWH